MDSFRIHRLYSNFPLFPPIFHLPQLLRQSCLKDTGVINIAVQNLRLCVKYYSFTQVLIQKTKVKGQALFFHFLYFFCLHFSNLTDVIVYRAIELKIAKKDYVLWQGLQTSS